MARRLLIDQRKRREICAILGVGCSRAAAASYAGCSPSTLSRELRRDPRFADEVHQAEKRTEVVYMNNIREAARKEQYWRAAAWILERCFPERYAGRGPDVITVPQIVQMLTELAEIIVAEIPIDRHRKAVMQRFDQLRRELSQGTRLAPRGRITSAPNVGDAPMPERTGDWKQYDIDDKGIDAEVDI